VHDASVVFTGENVTSTPHSRRKPTLSSSTPLCLLVISDPRKIRLVNTPREVKNHQTTLDLSEWAPPLPDLWISLKTVTAPVALQRSRPKYRPTVFEVIDAKHLASASPQRDGLRILQRHRAKT
jgi:hypothetical protein